jgi:predicted RNase H-like nuclease
MSTPARRPGQRGAPLPYKLLAGVEPCRGGWLVASAKLQGIQLHPQEPEIITTFTDVLDYKPAFQIIALHMPIGLPSAPSPGGRACDRDARKLLGWPRAGAILSPPVRKALKAKSYDDAWEISGGLNAVSWLQMKWIREVDKEIAPYWQRTVFEVHPDLSFFQLNDDSPMSYGKRTTLGQKERRTLLEKRMPGVDRILDMSLRGVGPWQLLDAAADLWTARRIASRAVSRVPEDPVWDDQGLRMEIIR